MIEILVYVMKATLAVAVTSVALIAIMYMAIFGWSLCQDVIKGRQRPF